MKEMKKSVNQRILENIKKNDLRFKDMMIEKSPNDFPTYNQFLKDIEEMDGIKNKELVIDESNNNTTIIC